MTEALIRTDVRGDGPRKTALITLDRPKQLNALTQGMIDTVEDLTGITLDDIDAPQHDILAEQWRQQRKQGRTSGKIVEKSVVSSAAFRPVQGWWMAAETKRLDNEGALRRREQPNGTEKSVAAKSGRVHGLSGRIGLRRVHVPSFS